MAIFVVGINHKTAPIDLREKIYFRKEDLSLYLHDILSQSLCQEAVLLSTCNRSELYCETHDISRVKSWFCAQSRLDESVIEPHIYIYESACAISHMMKVVCGLDSMILGEPQILGQMKEAFAESCTASAIGTSFHRLFQEIFAVAKEIRTTTAIGACPVSVASAAVYFAKHLAPQFNACHVAIIGAGDTSDLLARYLSPHVSQPLAMVNRTYQKLIPIADKFNANVVPFEHLNMVLKEADILFSATGSVVPILQKKMMQEIMVARAGRPLTIIDIAVPRDVEAEVAELPNVALYSIDDLKHIIERNKQGREHAACKAYDMIEARTQNYVNEMNSLEKVTSTIRAYRGQVEEICRNELIKAQQKLHQGLDPALVLDQFAAAYTQKLLHSPSVQLRRAAIEGRLDILQFAKRLFALPDTETEIEAI